MFITRRRWITGSAAAALAAQSPEPPVRLPRKVRLALIGLEGHTRQILSPLGRLPEVELAAVAHPDPAALARAAKKNRRLARARHYRDYREMLDREKLDVAAVCNPNGDRAAVVLACLRRGLHVAAEKPLALNRAGLEQIRRALRDSGVHLTMLLPMRFSGPYLAIKSIADSGEIGEVAQIASQKSYQAGNRPAWMRHRASYGGTIPWIGIHMIDLMRWASGREFTEAFSLTSHVGFPQLGDMENVTASVFRLDNGGIAVLRMDYLRPATAGSHGDDRLRLAGTRGVVEYQAATGVTVVSLASKARRVGKLPPDRSLFIDFLESVYNGKPASLSREDIFRANEITLAAQEAADRGAIVPC